MKTSVLMLLATVLIGGAGYAAQNEYFLTGNLRDVKGTAATDRGQQRIAFSGAIGFRVVPSGKGISIYLVELNLVSAGLVTKRGRSGILGVGLQEDVRLAYDPRTGRATGRFPLTLHYQLLDKVKGLREGKTQGETDQFAPFTEAMEAELSVRFPEGLRVKDEGNIAAEFEVAMDLSSAVLGAVRRIATAARFRLDWARALAPALFLKVQPVFIGRNSSDPNVTGKDFPELMKRAADLWNRCGSVRCIKFTVNRPIYINRPSYRVLETESEAASLRAEVNIDDAVEVFVVERMDFACRWGGGACFSCGTAAAKIVTSDQQLRVPAPCPCPSFCPHTCPPCPPCQTGAVNHYHLAHELGHALNLAHPYDPHDGLVDGSPGSNMEPSGLCCDNPDVQSTRNCRLASNPLLYWGRSICRGSPDTRD